MSTKHPIIRRTPFSMAVLLLGLFLSLSSLVPNTCQAQDKGTQWMGVRGSRLGFFKGHVVQNYGLELRAYVAKNVALNYSLTFGADENSRFYMHSYLGGGGAGVLGAAALADSSGGLATLKGIGALLSLFVPEGVTFAVPVSDQLSITPYVDPLGFDIYNGNLKRDLFVSGKVGARLKFFITDKLVAQPYGGIEALYYKDLPLASEFGLAISYRVGKEDQGD